MERELWHASRDTAARVVGGRGGGETLAHSAASGRCWRRVPTMFMAILCAPCSRVTDSVVRIQFLELVSL